MKKTFKAVDGRRVRMSKEQIREGQKIVISSVLAPILTIIVFAWAGGMIP